MSSAVSSDAARQALVQTALETDSAGVEALAASSKTERCGDRWLGAALYTLWANGCYDESATSTLDQSEITRIGRYLFAEDEQGFIGYREYADERSAELFLGDQTY